MKDSVFFSVIVPVYNGAQYLEEAIQSVVAQTFPNWELIIVDDGSKDKSVEIARNWADRNEKISFCQHDTGLNKGVSISRNLAISLSKGNWISLLDADDSWFPDKLEKEIQIINSYPDISLIYSKAKRIYTGKSGEINHNSLYGTGKHGEISDSFRSLIAGFVTSTSEVTFRKEYFIKCGGFDEKFRFSEDTLLFHQLMEHGNVFCIDEVLGTHRIHVDSVVSTTSLEKKIISRYKVYENLLLKVKTENIPLVSAALLNPGLLNIFRTFIFFPSNRFDLVFKYLRKTLNNSNLSVSYKIKALLMFVKRY